MRPAVRQPFVRRELDGVVVVNRRFEGDAGAGDVLHDRRRGTGIRQQVVCRRGALQAERVLKNLAAVLESAGASWADVVKTTVYLQDMTDFPRVNEVYGRMIGDARPARSTVQVSGLPRGVLVEIDAVAVVK